MLGTALGTKDISVKKKKKKTTQNLWSCGAYMIVETNNEQTNNEK